MSLELSAYCVGSTARLFYSSALSSCLLPTIEGDHEKHSSYILDEVAARSFMSARDEQFYATSSLQLKHKYECIGSPFKDS